MEVALRPAVRRALIALVLLAGFAAAQTPRHEATLTLYTSIAEKDLPTLTRESRRLIFYRLPN